MHRNARLTPQGRLLLCQRIEGGDPRIDRAGRRHRDRRHSIRRPRRGRRHVIFSISRQCVPDRDEWNTLKPVVSASQA